MAGKNENQEELEESLQEELVAPKRFFGISQKALGLLIALLVFSLVLVCIVVQYVISPSLNNENERRRQIVSLGEVFVVEDLQVNLLASEKAHSVLVQVGLELDQPKLAYEMKIRSMQIRDLLIDVFRNKSLKNMKELTIKSKLKREIIDRVNAELEMGEVVNVFFGKMFVIEG